MPNKFYSLLASCFILFCCGTAKSQCVVAVSDSLLPSFDLQLTGTPVSGVPPFTFNWTITGTLSGAITPLQVSAAGDTILISSADLFTNYGCIIITLCIQDATGCTNCLSDTAYTNAIICYSDFNWQEIQPGQMNITLNNPVPEYMGFTVVTWSQNGVNYSAPLFGGTGVFTYSPDTYSAGGYDVPICVQTLFQNISFMCIACDTVHFSAAAFSGIADESNQAPFTVHYTGNELIMALNTLSANAVADLFDMSGRLLVSVVSNSGKRNIAMNVADISKGIYIVRLRTAAGIHSRKMILVPY